MEHTGNELTAFTGQDMMAMLNESSQLISKYSASQLSSAAVAAQGSAALTDTVEFWKWMGRNYHRSGIFNSPSAMQSYIAGSPGKADWFMKQVQGKGYEWDWMTTQRSRIGNILKTYDAGDVVNRAASDVTERSILTGHSTDYQMKAYTKKTNPDLKTTPKSMTVVTSAEKTGIVQKNGYTSVEEFQDSHTIKSIVDKRMKQVRSGKAHTAYNVQNVTATMAQAGLIGCVIGLGMEAVTSYRSWKQGQLADEEYLREIMRAGGDAGVTSGATAGIMIPVSAAVTAAGISTWVTIPVAFVASSAVNKIVAPCFRRGEYRELLSEARYYQNIEAVYGDLLSSMQAASEEYYNFVCHMAQQAQTHQAMKEKSTEMNSALKNLFDSI